MNCANVISTGHASGLTCNGRVHDQLIAMFFLSELLVDRVIDPVESAIGPRYVLNDGVFLQEFIFLLQL